MNDIFPASYQQVTGKLNLKCKFANNNKLKTKAASETPLQQVTGKLPANYQQVKISA